MSNLTQMIRRHLDENEVRYHVHECEDADAGLTAVFSGRTCQVWMGIQVYEDERRLYFSAYNGVKIAPKRIQAAYEFIARANYGLPIGAFWIDEHNELRFATTAAVADLEPTDCWFRTYVCNTLTTFDRFFPALCQVVYAGVAANRALESMGEPTEEQIQESLSHLFGSASEHMQEPFEGLEDDEQMELPDVEADDPSQEQAPTETSVPEDRSIVIKLPQLPNLIAKVSPQDIEDIKRITEGRISGTDSEETDGDE